MRSLSWCDAGDLQFLGRMSELDPTLRLQLGGGNGERKGGPVLLRVWAQKDEIYSVAAPVHTPNCTPYVLSRQAS